MIKGIVFDLNGVFIQSPKLSDRFKEEFGVQTEDFLSALQDVMSKARLPNAGDSFQYWQPYLAKWNVHVSREDFFDFWFSAEKAVPEMIEFARVLKDKELKLFILSNNFEERASYYSDHFPFLQDLFDRVYYSWQTGFKKPDPKGFERIFQENGLSPQECMFFDDSEQNIKVAQSLGMKAYLFSNVEQVKAILKIEGLDV